MGQKVHPTGFRLGFNKTWNSYWYHPGFSNYNGYSQLFQEDFKIHDYIRATLRSSKFMTHLPKIYRKSGSIQILLNLNLVKIKFKRRRFRFRRKHLLKKNKFSKNNFQKGLTKFLNLKFKFPVNKKNPNFKFHKLKKIKKIRRTAGWHREKNRNRFKKFKTWRNLKLKTSRIIKVLRRVRRISRILPLKFNKFQNLKKFKIVKTLKELHWKYQKFYSFKFKLKKKLKNFKNFQKKYKKLLWKFKSLPLENLHKALEKYKKTLKSLRFQFKKFEDSICKYENFIFKYKKLKDLNKLYIIYKIFKLNKLKRLKLKLYKLKEKFKEFRELKLLKPLKHPLKGFLNKLKRLTWKIQGLQRKFQELQGKTLNQLIIQKKISKNQSKNIQNHESKKIQRLFSFITLKKLRETLHKKNSQTFETYQQKILFKNKPSFKRQTPENTKIKSFKRQFLKIKSNLKFITNSKIKLFIRRARKKYNFPYNPFYLGKSLVNTLENPLNKKKFVFLFYQLYRTLKSISLKLKYKKNQKKKIKGFRIKYAGKLWSKGRSKKRLVYHGPVPLQSLNEFIDYNFTRAITKYGVTGFKIWFNYFPRKNYMRKSMIHYNPYEYLYNHQRDLKNFKEPFLYYIYKFKNKGYHSIYPLIFKINKYQNQIQQNHKKIRNKPQNHKKIMKTR